MRRAGPLLALLATSCVSGYRPPEVSPPRRVTPTPTPPPVVSTPAPGVTPTPRPVPPPLPPPAADLTPPLVRVLLQRAREVRLPQPGRVYRLSGDGVTARILGPVTVLARRIAAWQVGAWGDPGTAEAAARKVAAALGGGVTVWREPAPGGLVRVRVRWERPPADPAAVLQRTGFSGAIRVPVEMLRVETGTGSVEAAGELVLEPEGRWPVAVGERRYRGRLRFRTQAGRVLVINELNLERYLDGVVPLEMGPAAFPELAALKAQAVAARTYTVAHLGDHDDEGYDLCATPACQVYGGYDAEHPLSTRAVHETAGIIAVYGGEPIDAMYTSTCGGHTEDAGELFPDRAQPYLKGVTCAWERPLELVGSALAQGPWQREEALRAEVARRALGLGGDPEPFGLVQALAATCGRPPPATGEGDAAFAAAALAACGLEGAATLEVGDGPVDRLVALADRQRVPLAPPAGERTVWRLTVAEAVLELAGVVARDRGEAVPRPEGVGIYPARADTSEPLPSPLPLWERWDGVVREVPRARVLPGTLLERWRAGGTVLALAVVRSGGGGTADRRSRWSFWTRELRWGELARRLGMPGLRTLEITRRSPTGRVVGLRSTGRGGRTREWHGFEVREALGVPETWFAMAVFERNGTRVVRFWGRGWGHGVGLCQNGAYGLARAGMSYDAILRHYYRGIDLVTWSGESVHPHPVPH